MSKRLEDKKYLNDKFDIKVWLKLWPFIKKHRRLIIVSSILNFFIAISDVIFPYLDKIAIDSFVADSYDIASLIIYIAVYLGIIISVYIIFKIYFKKLAEIEMGIAYYLRKTLFEKFQRLNIGFYDNNSSGFLLARITSDVTKLSEILSWSFIDISWGLPKMILTFIVMVNINVKLTLGLLVLSPIILLISYLFDVILFRNYRNVRKINSQITNNFSESIAGLKTIKTLAIEDKNNKEFKVNTLSMKQKLISTGHINALFRPIIEFLSSFAIAAVIWIGGESALKGHITLGTLAMFINYSKTFFDPLRTFAWNLGQFQMANANAERIVDLLESDDVIKEDGDVFNKYGDNLDYDKIDHHFKGDIEFKNVNFSYIENEPILNNFNLTIKHGETIALVGPTGSGKSTIVNLLCRFYEPNSGEILIDNCDYRKYSMPFLLNHIGYVLQSPHLFNDSIYENIICGDCRLDKKTVIDICKKLNAHEFITKQENAYDTNVGEGGMLLSGGQRQLISFARALVKNPDIFVLDEATSSIDTETERIIQKTIDNSIYNKTSIVVAHRLSTIVNVDRILFIEKGQIIEEGNHQELMAKKGRYYELYLEEYREKQISELI